MFDFNLSAELDKEAVFSFVLEDLETLGYKISIIDKNRPWGGFFVLDETQIRKFKSEFFPDVELSDSQLSQKLSPKLLIVAPNARLSWQYHHRRAELWKLIAGSSAICRSQTDEEGPVSAMQAGQAIALQDKERHRLIGSGNWGIVAEIWMHSDPENPSDEDDIVRLQDDYSRK
jgi:mannose-6-phosphate isomerase